MNDAIRSLLRFLGAIAFIAVAASCVPTAQPPAPEKAVPPDLAEAFYRQAIAQGEPVYRVDMARSLAVIHVFRAGSLARLGHDHVIAARAIHGYALLPADLAQARADLYVALDTLSVDEPALRAQAGLTTTPSAADIEGTRTNMLVRTLDSAHYPYLAIRLSSPQGTLPAPTLNTEITLHGTTRTLPLTVTLDAAGDLLRATGQFSIHQTDFGIAPMSVLGGALQVRDQVDIDFEIYAERLRELP
jgi:hypothetical protein